MATRVLVAEDSPIFAEALRQVIEGDPDLEVCGFAMDGRRAVELSQSLEPDLITMDVRMPVMNGLKAIGQIMALRPTPILVMTSDPRGETGELAVEALRRGALDLMVKPLDWPVSPREVAAIRDRIKLLAKIPVVRHMKPKPTPMRAARRLRGQQPRIVAVGASTGGPPALASVLSQLSAGFPLPIVVVQHISAGFAENLVRWLSSVTRLDVALARDGDRVERGRVLLAPDQTHLEVGRGERIHLTSGPPVDGHRPSVTVLFESVARVYGEAAAGLVLTGMGRDGAAGLLAMRQAGGSTAAQDQGSCAVWGMPRAAVEAGAVQDEIALGDVGAWLARLSRGRR